MAASTSELAAAPGGLAISVSQIAQISAAPPEQPPGLADGVLAVGADCCGLCTVWHALIFMGFRMQLLFAADISKSVRAFVRRACAPVQWFGDIRQRDNWSELLPSVDVYSCGFPCQPFSSAGLRLGLADARGTVFFSCAEYIDAKRPRLFVLENVKGLLSHDRGRTFELILRILRAIGGGCYDVSFAVLNTEEHGVPHHRPRLYIVGRRRDCVRARFGFPAPLPPVRLSEFLQAVAPPQAGQEAPRGLAPAARRNLAEALQRLAREGKNPERQIYVIDVNAGPGFRTVMLERSPCFLRSRARGFYLSDRGRRMTISEMIALQGFHGLSPGSTGPAALGAMLGNAMSMNVVVRLLACAFPSLGVPLPPSFVDPWNSSAQATRARAMPAAHGIMSLNCFCLFSLRFVLFGFVRGRVTSAPPSPPPHGASRA